MPKIKNTVSGAPPPTTLSPRELATVAHLAAGATCKEIAADVGISVKTVDTHRGHALAKLGLRNGADLARYAMHHGMVDADGVIDFAVMDEIAKLRDLKAIVKDGPDPETGDTEAVA